MIDLDRDVLEWMEQTPSKTDGHRPSYWAHHPEALVPGAKVFLQSATQSTGVILGFTRFSQKALEELQKGMEEELNRYGELALNGGRVRTSGWYSPLYYGVSYAYYRTSQKFLRQMTYSSKRFEPILTTYCRGYPVPLDEMRYEETSSHWIDMAAESLPVWGIHERLGEDRDNPVGELVVVRHDAKSRRIRVHHETHLCCAHCRQLYHLRHSKYYERIGDRDA